MRFKIFNTIIASLFFLVFLGLAYIQLIRGGFYYDLSENNHIRIIELEAMRGRILDRKGVVLAESKFSFDVAVIPQEFPEEKLSRLSRILNGDIEALHNKLKLGYASPFAPVVVAKNISQREAILIEQEKLEIPGVLIQIKPQRYYPKRDVGAHLLGYVGLIDRSKITKLKNYGYRIQDIVGYSGVEEYYDKNLRGENGGTQVEVDNRGRQLRILGMRPSIKGQDLVLTIDSRLQQAATQLLSEQRGVVIVMQPYTGEILALVSSPSFDPNVFTIDYSSEEINRLFNDYSSPMLNRAISGSFPLGSVFKVVTTLSALETKKASANTSFTCQGKMQIGNREFLCWDTHGIQNLIDAITHSCNVYFYSLGLLTGPDVLTKYARDLGLGSPAQVDLPYEEKGAIPERIQRKLARKEGWYKGDTANFAIGQGEVLVTPLQAVRMMAAVINGGILIKPYIAKYIVDNEIHRSRIFPRSTFSKANLDLLKTSLRKVVASSSGTAHALEIENLKIAGKTGTAQTARGNPHAWFVGFCPSDKPKIVFCVFLEHGGSSQNAVLIAHSLLQFMLQEGLLK